MKHILRLITTTCIIFSTALLFVILTHIWSGNNTIQISSLQKLIGVSVISQLVPMILDSLSIKYEWIHLLMEFTLIEASVFCIGKVLNMFDFSSERVVFINFLMIAAVYGITIVYYTVAAKVAEKEINQRLERYRS